MINPNMVLEVFDNDSTLRILQVRHRYCGTAAPPPSYVQTGIACAKKAPLRKALNRDLLLPIPPCTWHRRTEGHLKAWETTIKADMELRSGQLDAERIGESF